MSNRGKWCFIIVASLTGIVLLSILFINMSRKWRAADKIAGVKATGKVFISDPEVIDALLQDAECREKFTEMDTIGDFIEDISDKRFHSLKLFPHLKIIRLEYLGNVDAFLEGIQGMASLEELSFHRSGVSDKGMRYIVDFPNIKRLAFDDHTDFNLLDSLKNHAGIESLWLSEYKTSNNRLGFLKTLPSLRKLGLTLDLNDILDLRELPNLEILYLGDSLATNEALANLVEMKNLSILDCEGHNITDAGLVHLRDKTKLKHLNLMWQPITDAGLEDISVLTNLEELDLCKTKITDAGIKHLEKLKALRYLDIQLTDITNPGLIDLQHKLPRCKIDWR